MEESRSHGVEPDAQGGLGSPAAAHPPERPRARSATGVLRVAIKVGFAVGVGYYLVAHAPVPQAVDVLVGINLWYLLVALSVAPVSAWGIAAQQKILTDWQGLSLTVRQIMGINLVTRYYDLLLPGYLSGVAVRWPRMARQDGKPVEALAAIVFNRYLTMLTVVVLATVFWYLGRPPGLGGAWGGALLITVGAGLLAVHPLFFSCRLAAWYGRMLTTGWLGRLPDALKRRAARFATAAGRFEGLPGAALAQLTLLSVLRGMTTIVSFAFLAWALGIGVSFVAAGWVRSMLKLAGVIPFSVMGVGIREVGVVVLLQYLGVSPADAVALSVLLVARNLVKALAGGVLEARYSLRTSERTAGALP